jgi:hypothetical protein
MSTDSIYNSLGRYAQDDTNGHLHDFVGAIAADLDLINGIVGEGDQDQPTWTAAFDLDRAPGSTLPWLAQFVGATVTPAMTDEQARQAIRTPDGFAVGTVAAIRAAAERTLTGTKRVIIHERTPDLGSLYVRTLASETPDPALTEAAIRSQKPWHLVLEYEATSSISYIDLAEMFATYDDLTAADLTYDELSELEP